MDCVFGTPKQQNEGLIKKSPGPNCLKVDEKHEVSMADYEDGKQETTVSKKDIAGRVTFVEMILSFSRAFVMILSFLCAFSADYEGVMGRGCKRIIMMM